MSMVSQRKIRTDFLPLILAVLSFGSAIASYYFITSVEYPFAADPTVVTALVIVNLLFLFLLVYVILQRVFRLASALKRGSAGSRLHIRILTAFGLVAIIPAIVVSVFSVVFFSVGVQSWFETKVRTALEESMAVAEAYLQEHKALIRSDVVAVANDINRESYRFMLNPPLFNQFVSRQVMLRSLTEAIVFQKGRGVIARSSLSFSTAFERFPADVFEQAENGQVVLLTSDNEDRVRALIKLDSYADAYLLVERLIDAKVIHHMEATQGAVTEYEQLHQHISGLQTRFTFVFAIVVLLMLLAVIWYGMIFATRFMKPVGGLFRAAERIRAGDYGVRVPVGSQEGGELASFSLAFNKMADQLGQQRRELVEANRQLDARRHFIETVLAGVSAGVIALDGNRCITLVNRSATQMLGLDVQEVRGRLLSAVIPEMAALLERLAAKGSSFIQDDMMLQHDDKHIILHVRIAADEWNKEIVGYVATFDDISDLVAAQRKAAWSGVARRIAHEIKNPLTPIQLSAERLKKKYLGQITHDADTFEKYTDNIIRHVGSIGAMVEEFVAFARMPMPRPESLNLGDLVTNVVFSERGMRGDNIAYNVHTPDKPVMVYCDPHQLAQVFTNVLKNAAEVLQESRDPSGKDEDNPILSKSATEASDMPRIDISLIIEDDNKVRILIEDNGPGFPAKHLANITEPYITTRAGGTGLGLAIVKKIVEDHKGILDLGNREDGNGAWVSILLPLQG